MNVAMNPAPAAARRSPIHDALEARGAEWRDVNGTTFAVRLRDEPAGDDIPAAALCDLSGLNQLGVKGPDAANWLSTAGVDVPADLYESRPLPSGGRVVRFGAHEFFLEDGIAGSKASELSEQLGFGAEQVYRVEHQDATFLLTGPRSLDVMAQTCGIDFREANGGRAIFTRVAGVSCALLPETIADQQAFRLWLDPSYAPYLWEELVVIVESLGGHVVGAGRLFPDLPA
ncbi:MAG: hypothetical protein DWQ34_06845 [Planctomycetota bacterium]|nr:MAG: hypothetical protein DWQ29_16225 [Planctomycetota bacterium]REJ95158.1 MAG: hypothetical protein DWQ34_06845 [Planctomycetota bacterium]REK23805.1 MAG: hypothetical protein DWQ41_16075 [Planctomycetota bacterium]REK32882.1 MAG: hypothetical protein DWQ45_16200 [Planctomycetota bacterium]